MTQEIATLAGGCFWCLEADRHYLQNNLGDNLQQGSILQAAQLQSQSD